MLFILLLIICSACNVVDTPSQQSKTTKQSKPTPIVLEEIKEPQKLSTQIFLDQNISLERFESILTSRHKDSVVSTLYFDPQGCQDSKECQHLGQCASIQNIGKTLAYTKEIKQCIAVNRSSCLSSLNCTMKGNCTPNAGTCKTKSSLDCQQSDLCKRYGLCHFMNQQCIAQEKSCQKSLICKTLGACFPKDHKCVRQNELQPECDSGCLNIGQQCICSAKKKTLKKIKVKVDPACIIECQKEGRCKLGKQGCKAISTRMCAQSELCTMSGRCALYKGECVASFLSCKSSIGCELLGLCNMNQGRCVVGDQSDCEYSTACKKFGYCTMPESDHLKKQEIQCIQTQVNHTQCKESCALNGLCKAEANRCIASNNGDCRNSKACKTYGRCSLINQRCQVSNSLDCKRSLECTLFGRCHAKTNKCVKL